jgi:diaminopimelate dehydrogenase
MDKIKKVKISVIGLGKLGQGVIDAASQTPDIEIVGVVEPRNMGFPVRFPFVIKKEIARIGDEEIAVLCVPTKQATAVAPELHRLGISTIDSFDMHQEANWRHYQTIKQSVQKHAIRALTSAGTDPGFCSMVRALFQIPAPWGITYTNYGPGTSMGHTVAVKAIPGVRDAIAVTIPKGFGLTRRDVFIEPEEDADCQKIRDAILADEYFCHDETLIYFVKNVKQFYDAGHKVEIERKGVAGKTHNQHFRFETIFTNNAITGQLLVASARALAKQPPGLYTMIDMPIRDYLTPLKDEEQLCREVI